RPRAPAGATHAHLEAHELGRQLRQSVELAVCPSHLESDGLPLDVSELPEAFAERLPGQGAYDPRFQIPNAVQLPRRLRVARERRHEEAQGDGRDERNACDHRATTIIVPPPAAIFRRRPTLRNSSFPPTTGRAGLTGAR